MIYGVVMPRRTDLDGPPNHYVTPWPDGPTTGPAEVQVAVTIAHKLADATAGRSLRDVGRQAGVDHTTIAGIIAGERWPNMVTLARLEQALDVALWPSRT